MACCAWALSLLLPLLVSTGSALDVVVQASQLKCSEGLTHCSLTGAFGYDPSIEDPDPSVVVQNVEPKVVLCCFESHDCTPCLQIQISLNKGFANKKEDSEEHGDEWEEGSGNKQMMVVRSGQAVFSHPRALVKVCLSSPGATEYCKAVKFIPTTLQQLGPEDQMWLLLMEPIAFGAPVVVQVQANSRKTYNITVPSLQRVCSMNLVVSVKGCDAPRIQAVIDQERDEVLLKLVITDKHKEGVMYQKFWNEMPGEVLEWPKGRREISIPLNSVAPCLCFRVWLEGKELHRDSCPFKNLREITEKLRNNVSVSMWEAQGRGDVTALGWNVTAPCRLEGEVWLCRKAPSAQGHCEEVTGSRQKMDNLEHAGWRFTPRGHLKIGEFINMSPHPALCIKIKLHGLDSKLETHCPFEEPRRRWSLLILTALLLICLAILVAYFLQGFLKGYVWRWFKEGDVRGTVGGSHVVLLYHPDGNQALPVQMCYLGSSLQALGFSVSLDLWSQAEVSVLGPVPWLHSQLDRLQRQGGKVVLVLTQASWARAEEWGTAKGRDRDVAEEDEEAEKTSFQYVDVFDASLSCILADYLQGRAGKRFVLVQLESLPPQPAGSSRPLPELFRGLYLYSLPSQSLGFLTELVAGRHGASALARWRKAGSLRILLTAFTAGSAVLRLAGLPQDCVGVEEEDTWEQVPLQPYHITPPSSHENFPRISGMEFV